MIFDRKLIFIFIFEALTHHVGKLFSAQVCNGSRTFVWLVCLAKNRKGKALPLGVYPAKSQKNPKTREKSSFFGGKENLFRGHAYINGIVLSRAIDSDTNISRELPLPGDISHFNRRVEEGKFQG
jgi:hypothetical protein